MAHIPLHDDIAFGTVVGCGRGRGSFVAEHEERVAALHCAAGEDGHRAWEGRGGEGGDEGAGIWERVEGLCYV
jgi:hypothetical protein